MILLLVVKNGWAGKGFASTMFKKKSSNSLGRERGIKIKEKGMVRTKIVVRE